MVLLPQPELADEAEYFPLPNGKGDAVDRFDRERTAEAWQRVVLGDAVDVNKRRSRRRAANRPTVPGNDRQKRMAVHAAVPLSVSNAQQRAQWPSGSVSSAGSDPMHRLAMPCCDAALQRGWKRQPQVRSRA